MGWMKQCGWSTIAAALVAAWLAQPDWVLGEFPSGNRVTGGHENSVGAGTGGGTDSVSARQFILPPSLPSERDARQQTTTPLGVPSPPHQLTPAPLLPFHPNRPLMPSPTIPPTPSLRGGHIGR
jgi:hypothetical protein